MVNTVTSHWPYPGIRTRIIGPFLLSIILIAGIGVFTVTRLVAGSIQERFSNQLADSASAASNSLSDIERQQLATLRLMVFTEGVPSALAKHDADSLEQWLRPIAANGRIDDLIVFDAAGQGILQLRRVENETGAQYLALSPSSVTDWTGIQRIIAGNVDAVGDKYVDVIGRAPDTMVYISAPVSDIPGHVVGGISVGLTGAHLARRVSAQSLSSVTLFANDGQVLGSTFQVTPETLALSPNRIDGLLNSLPRVTPVESIVLDGTPYQVLYAPLQLRSQRIGLLAAALPSDFIVDRSSTSRDLVGTLFSLLFVAVAVLGLLTARTITRPVAKLVNTTRAIREGDLSRRVQLQTRDELGELGISFDHMTDQLVQRNSEINWLYQEQVQETARREAVLASISDAVIVQDPNGNTIWQNPTAVELVRIVADHPTWQHQFVQLSIHPTELTQARTVSFGDQFFSVLATPVCLASDDLLGYVIVFRNITAIVEAEGLKDELIMQMSHELRTPLTATRGYIDLIKTLDRPNLSQQSQTFIDNAANSLSTLERMVDQVIDVSALVSNRFTLNFETFNLAQLLQDRVDVWSPVMQERELTLSLSVSPLQIELEGDAHWLSQIVDHVLRNSYSYTLPGGSVGVNAMRSESGVIITIIDTGIGIGPHEIDRVFDRMFRGRSADAGPTDARGLGLGLYVSQRIVEAHRGTIRLESQFEQGTTVTIELPLHQKSH